MFRLANPKNPNGAFVLEHWAHKMEGNPPRNRGQLGSIAGVILTRAP